MEPDKETPQQPVRVHPFYWFIAAVTAGVLLYYSLRGIEWARVGEQLKKARFDYVGLALLISTASLFMRAVRWRVLLQAEGKVSMPLAFWATCAGYCANNFLPARAGELVRTFMIHAATKLNNMFVLTTALSERVADAIALVTISAGVLLTTGKGAGWLDQAARPFGLLALGGVLGIAVLPQLDRALALVISKLPIPHALGEKLQRMLAQAMLGIRSFHHAGRLARFVALTILIWFSDALSTVVGVKALGLSVSLPVAFLLIAGLGLGSAIPSTPGYVGIYQFVAVMVLVPFGFSRNDAIAYILLAQAIQYVLLTILGIGGVARYRALKAQASGAH